MRYTKTAVSAAAMLLWVGALAAQQKPNFAGKWTLDAEKTAAANPAQAAGGGGGGGGARGGRGGGGGNEFTLALDAAANTLARTTEGQNGPATVTYKLDDSEQTITMGQGEAKVKAKWDGAKLVITTTRQGQAGAVTTVAEYTMEGEHLVISTTAPPRGGGDPTTTKRYFKKAA